MSDFMNTEKEQIHKEGTIATQGQKFIWTKGRWMPYGGAWFKAGDTLKQANARKKTTAIKKTEKAKQEVQSKLESFSKVKIETEGF